eukprot:3928022-Rhodomonas_salina.2
MKVNPEIRGAPVLAGTSQTPHAHTGTPDPKVNARTPDLKANTNSSDPDSRDENPRPETDTRTPDCGRTHGIGPGTERGYRPTGVLGDARYLARVWCYQADPPFTAICLDVESDAIYRVNSATAYALAVPTYSGAMRCPVLTSCTAVPVQNAVAGSTIARSRLEARYESGSA